MLYRNGVKAETIEAGENDLMEFETSENEVIVLVKEGTTPDQYRTELTSVDYHTVNDTGKQYYLYRRLDLQREQNRPGRLFERRALHYC